MGFVKSNIISQAAILRLESEMNNLWGELNTCNLSNAARIEMERKLSSCEEHFKAMLGGQVPVTELENELHKCDLFLVQAVLQQAENEIPKVEKNSSAFLALENIRQKLNEGNLSPVRARHEVKEIIRHHK
jgi:ribosome-associated translation inhibitor RaiA